MLMLNNYVLHSTEDMEKEKLIFTHRDDTEDVKGLDRVLEPMYNNVTVNFTDAYDLQNLIFLAGLITDLNKSVDLDIIYTNTFFESKDSIKAYSKIFKNLGFETITVSLLRIGNALSMKSELKGYLEGCINCNTVYYDLISKVNGLEGKQIETTGFSVFYGDEEHNNTNDIYIVMNVLTRENKEKAFEFIKDAGLRNKNVNLIAYAISTNLLKEEMEEGKIGEYTVITSNGFFTEEDHFEVVKNNHYKGLLAPELNLF